MAGPSGNDDDGCDDTGRAAAAPLSSSHIIWRRPTAPELLGARQLVGAARTGLPVRSGGGFGYRRAFRPMDLAAATAWNPKRLQNMSLAVGPGTPAAVLLSLSAPGAALASDSDASSVDPRAQWGSEAEEGDDDDDDDEEEEEENGDDDTDEDENEERDHDGNDDGLDDANDQNDDNAFYLTFDEPEAGQNFPHALAAATGGAPGHGPMQLRFPLSAATRRRRWLREAAAARPPVPVRPPVPPPPRAPAPAEDCADHEARSVPLERVRRRLRARGMAASMRHGGCINTACWLDVPWRFSSVDERAGVLRSSVVASYECPTQVATSGDDRLLKIWDCAGAMGTDNPLPGGWNTYCPFSMSPPESSDDFRQSWKDFYSTTVDCRIGVTGTTRNLKTTSTGHRGNVFHLTALRTDPGKFVTCAADGYLRLVDMAADRSSVVIHPLRESETSDNDFFRASSLMAYSHLMVSANVGLICSERGLHRFDVRLSPREQQTRSLIKDLVDEKVSWRTSACKACAVWNSHGCENDNMEATYVFAGGASETVGLFDLRMDGANGQIVQRYRPRELRDRILQLSVSGLDVSKDSRELLVSYESDQIYVFPVLSAATSPAGPTMEDIEQTSMDFERSKYVFIGESANFGGHLNRFTFLKNAKYAGPNDEYICTGSDSGHAWIYDRRTATVVSLLAADRSTCNGALPHPSLPFFITYGIESTAKLWRASNPVDPTVEDSFDGRLKCALHRKHELSPVTRMWGMVQSLLRRFDNSDTYLSMLPDGIASSNEITASGRFSSPQRRGVDGINTPQIGNAIIELPFVLRQNNYECFQNERRDSDVPVEQPLEIFTHHVSISRLKFQADRLGLAWNPWKPFILQSRSSTVDCDPSERIPDFPRDWLNYDQRLMPDVLSPRKHFHADDKLELRMRMIPYSGQGIDEKEIQTLSASAQERLDKFDGTLSCRILYETAKLCKDGGNAAIKSDMLHTAMRRYDKAIQYLALSLMCFGEDDSNLKHLRSACQASVVVKRGNTENAKTISVTYRTWSDSLKLLVMCRLNLSLLFLKPELARPDAAAAQAQEALQLLEPFCVAEGKIKNSHSKSPAFVKEDEPALTYMEAKAQQAKAYFRLGSAQLQAGDSAAAVKSLAASLEAAKASGNSKTDPSTVRLLHEAKQKGKVKKKRVREKYQRLLEEEEERTRNDTA